MGRGRATRLLGLLNRAGACLSEQSAGPVCRSSLPTSSLGEIRSLTTLAARHSTLPRKLISQLCRSAMIDLKENRGCHNCLSGVSATENFRRTNWSIIILYMQVR